ncbi:hypothetical protein GCK32_000269 [Trichostrongylus colubriformis]|uniref:Uncharacterized protein n=1 Tax=Trichostrongylus colubriformis TaxID=6319 RepID=A0AAN8EXN1_TRICO
MFLNTATWHCCWCVHIETLIHVILASTFITHLAVSTFLLIYSFWYAFIPVAITLLSHVLAFLAIRRRSFRLFTIFMIYEGFFIVALMTLDVWLLIVMEIKPALSFFDKKCYDRNKGACEKEVRQEAGIAGGVVFGILLLNILVLWPSLKNFLNYLRAASGTKPPTATIPVIEAAQQIPCTVPSAPYASESIRRPTFPGNSAIEHRPQPYTIYTPTAEPADPIEFTSSNTPGTPGNFYPSQQISKMNPSDYQQDYGGTFQQFEPPPPYL